MVDHSPVSLGCVLVVASLLAGSVVWDRAVNGNCSSVAKTPRAPGVSGDVAETTKSSGSPHKDNTNMAGRTKLANGTAVTRPTPPRAANALLYILYILYFVTLYAE